MKTAWVVLSHVWIGQSNHKEKWINDLPCFLGEECIYYIFQNTLRCFIVQDNFSTWNCSLYNTLVDFFLYFRSQFKCQFWENSILIFPNKEISCLLVIFHHWISSDYCINKCMHRYSYMHACVCLVYSDAFHTTR